MLELITATSALIQGPMAATSVSRGSNSIRIRVHAATSDARRTFVRTAVSQESTVVIDAEMDTTSILNFRSAMTCPARSSCVRSVKPIQRFASSVSSTTGSIQRIMSVSTEPASTRIARTVPFLDLIAATSKKLASIC